VSARIFSIFKFDNSLTVYIGRFEIMKSYIKIFGPPILKAIRALELIALDMPEVRILNTLIVRGMPASIARDVGASTVQTRGTGSLGLYPGGSVRRYFSSPDVVVPVEKIVSLISDAGESLGDYDFFYEWAQEPTQVQLFDLIDRIEAALTPLGCKYRITTKNI
jgi:hypothetical protein